MPQVTQSEISSVMEKIKKLLSLATSPNEFEAARANDKVQELLLAYNMSMGDIKESDAAVTEEVLFETSRSVKWKESLVAAVASFYDCMSMSSRSSNGLATSIMGSPGNVTVTIAMIEYFTAAIDRVAKEDKSKGVSITLTYRYGIVMRISQKLRERKAAIKSAGFTSEAGTVSALAVQSQSDAAAKDIQRFIRKQYPQARTATIKSNGNRGSLRDGFNAGDRVGIDSQMNSGRGQRQLAGA